MSKLIMHLEGVLHTKGEKKSMKKNGGHKNMPNIDIFVYSFGGKIKHRSMFKIGKKVLYEEQKPRIKLSRHLVEGEGLSLVYISFLCIVCRDGGGGKGYRKYSKYELGNSTHARPVF